MTSIPQILADIKIVQNQLNVLNQMLYDAEYPGRVAYEYTQRGLENRFTRAWSELSREEKDKWIAKSEEALSIKV